jgi:uncharacterized protein (DUF1778 family)
LEEGVKIVNGFGPKKLLKKGAKLSGVEFKRCISVFDDQCVFNPKYNAKDLTQWEADTVIIAIGQAADLSFAEKLLHMDARIPGSTIAAKQLDGAVAAANILERRKVVYLADEVGMGKTYVALGAMAILRHVYPDFRVLIIAPRGNIQTKWKRELELFYRHNVRVKDLRNKGLDGGSAKPIALCDSVFEFVRQASANPHQDYILRLSSFSLAASIGDAKDIVTEESAAKLIDRVKSTIPWLDKRSLANRNKQQLKSKQPIKCISLLVVVSVYPRRIVSMVV